MRSREFERRSKRRLRQQLRRDSKYERHITRVAGRPKRVIPPGWLTADKIAFLLGVSRRWVYRHLGGIAHRLNARDYRWRCDEIDRWLSDLRTREMKFSTGTRTDTCDLDSEFEMVDAWEAPKGHAAP